MNPAFLLLLPLTFDAQGAQIFSQMLNKYYQATSLKGTIEWTQTALSPSLNTKTTTLTTVVMKRPNFFYLEQRRDRGEERLFLAVCDGKQMAYSTPKKWRDIPGAKPFVYEPAPQDIKGALDACAPLVLDRSLPVSVALYNPYEVQQFVNRVKNVTVIGETTSSGTPGWKLKLDYVYSFASTSANRPEIVIPLYVEISKNYDLLSLSWQQILQETPERKYTVTDSWRVRLEVNVPVDEKTFVVPKS